MIASSLPRGIWYEEDRKRYRVRLYRNTIPYLKGYYTSLAEAEAALNELREELKERPKRRCTHAQRVPCSTFQGVAESVHEERQTDPRPYKN